MKDLSEISSSIFASFLRSSYTSLFLQYNPIGAPYGPNFLLGRRKELVQEYLLNTLNVVLKEAIFWGRDEMNFLDHIGWALR